MYETRTRWVESGGWVVLLLPKLVELTSDLPEGGGLAP